MKPGKNWSEQCEAARRIEDAFGTQKALDYLVGEQFINFLEAAETPAAFREVPAFVAEIKTVFEPWQLAVYLETARQTEPFDFGVSAVSVRFSVQTAVAAYGCVVSSARTALPRCGADVGSRCGACPPRGGNPTPG